MDEEGYNGMKEGLEEAKQREAEAMGDSYCKECQKYAEGKVSICPYCGQYID